MSLCRLKAERSKFERCEYVNMGFLQWYVAIVVVSVCVDECFGRSTHKSHCVIVGDRAPPTHQRGEHLTFWSARRTCQEDGDHLREDKLLCQIFFFVFSNQLFANQWMNRDRRRALLPYDEMFRRPRAGPPLAVPCGCAVCYLYASKEQQTRQQLHHAYQVGMDMSKWI